MTNNQIPAVGSPAPDFTLKTTGGEFTLSSRRGKNPVLLAFFPLAFTDVCTAEMHGFRDEYPDFGSTGVEIVPISVDSVDTLKEFKRQHQLPVEMASDFKREISRLYGVLLEDRFYSNRAYFLIDRDGAVRWAHVEERRGLKRTNDEILAQIRALS